MYLLFQYLKEVLRGIVSVTRATVVITIFTKSLVCFLGKISSRRGILTPLSKALRFF